MQTNIHLLFYLKKAKNTKNGPIPIYLRITVKGHRAEVSTGKACDASRWNSHAGRVIGNKEETKLLNAHLDNLYSKVIAIHHQLLIKGKEISATLLRDELCGRNEKERFLLITFQDHNEKLKALIGNGFEENTLKSYRTSFRHLKEFIQWKYSLSDITISKLNYEFITNFEFYLQSQCKCSLITAAKYIKNLKKITNSCLAHGWLAVNPFANYKSKAKPTKRIFLTKEEIDSIQNKEIRIERISQVRDIFLFCCYTGLAYADIKKLKQTEIQKGFDGALWIHTFRKKTDTASRVPLLPKALDIIEKYKNHPQCAIKELLLPVLSNQKMNAYLKEIADLCDIYKPLTFHTARHTFATTVTLGNGVPIESVSKMLGHTNIKTTQHYAKILDSKVSEDMKVLRKKLTQL